MVKLLTTLSTPRGTHLNPQYNRIKAAQELLYFSFAANDFELDATKFASRIHKSTNLIIGPCSLVRRTISACSVPSQMSPKSLIVSRRVRT